MSFTSGQSETGSGYNELHDASCHRLSVKVAIIFIVGTMCGSGILALPKALVESGWFGIVLLILCGVISSYTGSILGKCWVIIKQRYDVYDDIHVSDPYPTIGYRAAGRWGAVATRICIIFTLFGGGVVYLLLIVENIDNLIQSLGHASFHTCFLIPIVGAVLLPFSWLGTPKDFWQAGVLAAITTSVGAVFIVAGLGVMAQDLPPATHSNPTFSGFFTAFGTILFGFGGASIFPTLQIDMKRPEKFPVTVAIGITCVLIIYSSVSIAGFAVLGDCMGNDNILYNMDRNWILYTVIVLITSHLLLGFIIVINPVSQDLEGLFKIEDKFSLKRALARSFVMVLLVLVALSIPHFGIILSLVGATTIAATNFIFPPLFYILLSRQRSRNFDQPEDITESQERILAQREPGSFLSDSEDDPRWVNFDIPLHIKVLLIEIMLIGAVGGIASVYSTIQSLADGSSGFTSPCFSNWAAADAKDLNTTGSQCTKI